MKVDRTPSEKVVISKLRPVLLVIDGRVLLLLELTLPWEERIEEAHHRKLKCHEELVFEIQGEDVSAKYCRLKFVVDALFQGP